MDDGGFWLGLVALLVPSAAAASSVLSRRADTGTSRESTRRWLERHPLARAIGHGLLVGMVHFGMSVAFFGDEPAETLGPAAASAVAWTVIDLYIVQPDWKPPRG